MSYTYDQRKRPQGRQNQATEPAAAPGPIPVPLRADTAGAGNADGLASAMQERIWRTFGDLSAVKSSHPTVRTQAAPVSAEPYAGPVDHAVSAASPAPSAAGPMQAKRGDRTPTKKEYDAGANEMIGAHETYAQTIHGKMKGGEIDQYYDLGYDKAEMNEMVNGLIEKGKSDYLKQQVTQKELDFWSEQNKKKQNYDSKDDFEYSFDAEDAPETAPDALNQINQAPKKAKDQIDPVELEKIKRSAMIEGLTYHSRNRVLKSWNRIMKKGEEDHSGGDGITEVRYSDVKHKKEPVDRSAKTKQKLMGSASFKRWMRLKTRYQDMPFEDLEREYNNVTDKSLRKEWARSNYSSKWYRQPFIKFDMWKKGVYNIKKNAPEKEMIKPSATLQRYMEEKRLMSDLRSGEFDKNFDKMYPETTKGPKSKEETTADEMFRIRAGILGDYEEPELMREQVVNSVKPQFLEEERKKEGGDPDMRARLRAGQYYNKHKPKRKNITGSKDQKWYDKTSANPSVDLIREISNRRNRRPWTCTTTAGSWARSVPTRTRTS